MWEFEFWREQEIVLRRHLLGSSADSGENNIEDRETRMHNDMLRTVEFLWVFTLFCSAYCSLSCYVYTHPLDGPGGMSLVSKLRSTPFFSWFFRQSIKTDGTPMNSEHQKPTERIERQSFLKADDQTQRDSDDEENHIELGIHDPPQHSGTVHRRHSIADSTEDPERLRAAVQAAVRASPSGSSTPRDRRERKLIGGSEGLTLAVCAASLITAYLIWGFMQERIIGHPYGDADDEGNWFHSSQWCVLLNRASGLILSTVALNYFDRSGNDCPPYLFSLCALSNLMSSWLQYEALHFITFPVQTIFKSSKVFVTMLVGSVMGKKFPMKKYVNALVIGFGVSVFLFGQKAAKEGGSQPSDSSSDGSQKSNEEDAPLGWYFVLGLGLITGYAFCDAFTSNWQSKVFGQTKINSLEMMRGVNACTFAVSAMLSVSDLPYILDFYSKHPLLWLHSILMAAASGFGTMIIFFTIEQFGPMVFSAVMTTRMMFSVILSIIYYSHPVSATSMCGMVVTFCALFYQVYSKK